MKLNFFRKPLLGLLLSSSVLFFSCKKYDISSSNSTNSFSYSTYDEFKEKSIDLTLQATDDINAINKEIYDKFNVDVSISKLDELYYSEAEKNTYITKKNSGEKGIRAIEQFLTELDLELLHKFNADNETFGLESALVNFEANVQAANVTAEVFEKYNTFVNVVKIVDDLDDEIISAADPCAKAIAANALATVALAACGGGPFFCAIAIASKVLAVDAVIEACKDKK